LTAAAAFGAAPATASTITGKLVGAKLPAPRAGLAFVRAVDPDTGVIVADKRVRNGRYALTVPAGSYVLLASTTSFRGKAGIDRIVGNVKVRKGARKSVPLTFKRKKPRRRLPKLPKLPTFSVFPSSAHASFVNVKYPAVWVQHFNVSGPSDWSVFRKGMADMLITDIASALPAACKGVVVEREHLQDIINEQLLQQSPAFDPTTRVPLGRIIAHNRVVNGTIVVSGQTATMTVNVQNVAAQTTRSVTRSGPADRPFELEQSIVQEVVRLICGDKPPSAYEGPVSGHLDAPEQKLSWSGNVRMKFVELGVREGEVPRGEYAYYEVEHGSLHLILDGTDGDCTYHGEGDVNLEPTNGRNNYVQQGVDEPTYALQENMPNDTAIPYTSTGPAHCASSGMFPIGGRVYVSTNTPQRSSTNQLSGSVTVNVGYPLTWSWTLSPQA
jgi:hypothetical protein